MMRRNCVECRHWEIEPTDEDWQGSHAVACGIGHWGRLAVIPEMKREIRTGLRRATDCGDYEAVEPTAEDCTCGIDRQEVGGAFEHTPVDELTGLARVQPARRTTMTRVVDPKCPLHGAAGRSLGPAEIDLELL